LGSPILILNIMNRLIIIISITAIIASLGIIGFVVYQNYQPIIQSSAKITQSVVNFFPQALDRILVSSSTNSSQFGNDPLTDKQSNQVITPLLEKISLKPVASFDLLKTSKETEILVYIEKESGNIFSLKIENQATSSPQTEPELIRLSNLTIPTVFEAYFGLDQAKNVQALVRFPDQNRQLQTISLSIEANTTNSSASSTNPWLIKTVKLSPNIYNFSVSPDKTTVFYLENIGAKSIAYTANFKLQNKKLMLVSPFSDWKINWSTTNTVYFYPRPDANYSASLYVLNLKDRSFKKIINSVKGLSALASPDDQYITYTNSFNNDFNLLVHNNKTNSNTDLYLKTFPEKCLWDKDWPTIFCSAPKQVAKGAYPNDWLLGQTNFNDSLWLVYPELGKISLFYDFKTPDENLDLISLKQDRFNNLYFIDRKTGTLYRLNSSRLLE